LLTSSRRSQRADHSGWIIDVARLRERFDLLDVRAVNDFEAVVWSQPHLARDLLRDRRGRAVGAAVVFGLGVDLGLPVSCPYGRLCWQFPRCHPVAGTPRFWARCARGFRAYVAAISDSVIMHLIQPSSDYSGLRSRTLRNRYIISARGFLPHR